MRRSIVQNLVRQLRPLLSERTDRKTLAFQFSAVEKLLTHFLFLKLFVKTFIVKNFRYILKRCQINEFIKLHLKI